MWKKIVFLILGLLILFSLFHNFLGQAESKKKIGLGEKLDMVLANQEKILTKLEEIKEELIKIKMRVTRL